MECLANLNTNIETIDEFIAAGGTISDNCDIDPASFTVNQVINRDIGRSEIITTFSIQDYCGNIDSCTQVLISTDTIPPVANCNDLTVYLNDLGIYKLTSNDIITITSGSSDNCTLPEDLTIQINYDEFTCEDIDEGAELNIIVTDQAGNSDSCNAHITVLDTVPPVAICQNVTVYLDENGQSVITANMIDNGSSDICLPLDTMFLSKYKFDCNDVGDNPVTLTVVDRSGQVDSCAAIVTVIDTIPPVVNCVAPFTVQLDENAQYSLTVFDINADSYDECGIDTMYLDIYDLNCDNIGVTPITLTVFDVNGNSSTCTTEITVYGNIAPVAQNDSATTLVNTSVLIFAADNDYDTKTSINISSMETRVEPRHGNITINTTNGMMTYTPARDFVGYDTVTYKFVTMLFRVRKCVEKPRYLFVSSH